ncbi:DUF4065 domain-containing protein [Salinicoccus cyprini]|uniref:DUF4065 domain-containing protein n=1 Tax=Salinicoccus cyprini TaxID=2493691 RepID=A0A558AXG6_9STAP|nr:type II TA system antitoxin MqsA family protein [Salinicoccus cyprini]TVT28947.1 DUF4065 domain-containing protein [Salinicoccus cyprini]
MTVTKKQSKGHDREAKRSVYCDNCNEVRQTHTEIRSEVYNIRGKNIEIESEVRVCGVCNEAIYDEQLDSLNINNAFQVYREQNNIMSSEEIVELRRRYGLSQRGLATILGWGMATVGRYESGAIPSNSHHTMLLNLRNDIDFAHKLYNENKDKLKKLDLQRMHDRLEDEQKKSEERDTIALLSKKIKSDDDPVLHGYAEFDFNKLVGMVVYLTDKLDKVSKTKLMKLLFYSDFRNFRETGLSISGLTYRHLPYGPVPDHHYLILDALSEMEHVKLEPFADYEGEYLIPVGQPDLSSFDEDELEILDGVINDFKNMNATDISEYSHTEKAYTETEDKDYISYEFADSLRD